MIAGILGGEALFRRYAPVPDPFRAAKMRKSAGEYIRSEFPPRFAVDLAPEPGLPGVTRGVRFQTNNLGFRGPDLVRPKPPDEVRIFLVGGSTTECCYLDDEDALHGALQKALAPAFTAGVSVRVYNAGKSGDFTCDHVAMVSQRIVHLEPDLVIIFAGFNDLVRSIHSYDYLHVIENPGLFGTRDLTKMLLTESQIACRLVYALWGVSPDEEQTRIGVVSNMREKAAMRDRTPKTDLPPRLDLEPYRRNLTTLAGIAAAHRFRLVFMTQVTTWDSSADPGIAEWHWQTIRHGVAYRPALLDDAIRTLNDSMRHVARESDVPLCDLEKSDLPRTRECFYDDCHFNAKGARTTAEIVAAFLRELRPGILR